MSWHEAKVTSHTDDSTNIRYNADEEEVGHVLTENSNEFNNAYKNQAMENDDENKTTESIMTDQVDRTNPNNLHSVCKTVPNTSIAISPMQPVRSEKSQVIDVTKDDVLAIPSTSDGLTQASATGSDNTANESSASASDDSSDSSYDSTAENTESQNTEKSSESSPTLRSNKGNKSVVQDSSSLLPVENEILTQISLKDVLPDVAQNYIYSAPVHSLCSDISAESAAKALTTTAKALTKTAHMFTSTTEKFTPNLMSPSSAATDLAFVTTALSDVTWTLSSLLTSKTIEYDQNKMTMLANAAAVAEARALSLVQSASKMMSFKTKSGDSLETEVHSNHETNDSLSLYHNSATLLNHASILHDQNTSPNNFEYNNKAIGNIKDSLEIILDSKRSYSTTISEDPATTDPNLKPTNADETNADINIDRVSFDSKTIKQCDDLLKAENYPENVTFDKVERDEESENDKSDKNIDEKNEAERYTEKSTSLKSPDAQGSTYTILVDNGYAIQYTLGTGSFSSVKVAISQKHKCKVAVRILTKSKVPQVYLDKFLPRVLKVVRILRHPNIVQFMQVIETTHRVYFIMEYAEHGSLLDRIRKDTYIVEPIARKWFRQMAEAINYLHDQGIVHRDIKCDNMLLDCYDDIKVSKFIFSRPNMFSTNGSDVLSETYCGTPVYAAPEILRGTPYKPQLSDIWSMGVVLFAMVYGRLPYTEDNIRTLVKRMEGKLSFPSEPKVSAPCRSLISRMMTHVRRRINISTVLCDRWCLDRKRPRSAPQRPTINQNENESRDGRILTKIFSPLKRLLRMRTNNIRDERQQEFDQNSSATEDHCRTKRNISLPLIENSNVPIGQRLCLPTTRASNSLPDSGI